MVLPACRSILVFIAVGIVLAVLAEPGAARYGQRPAQSNDYVQDGNYGDANYMQRNLALYKKQIC